MKQKHKFRSAQLIAKPWTINITLAFFDQPPFTMHTSSQFHLLSKNFLFPLITFFHCELKSEKETFIIHFLMRTIHSLSKYSDKLFL